MILPVPSYYSQSIETNQDIEDIVLQKLLLLTDLQTLEAKSVKLDKPLARAAAKAEIADAAWTLNESWAKKLLTEAYEITFPTEEEQINFRSKPIGTPPKLPTALDRARLNVRNRALSIAGRDKTFANQLVQLSARKLGRWEEHLQYAHLATIAINEGDKEAARQYILQSIEADPTQIAISSAIIELAAQDRAAADEVIVQYIERLRPVPLSLRNGSAMRIHYLLYRLIFPFKEDPEARGRQIPSPGPAVMRAYVSYMIESLGLLGQRDPEALRASRGFLLTAWLPLKQYAPELTGAFLEVEKLSRRPGEDASLPRVSLEESYRERYEERVRKNLDNGNPDPLFIESLISEGDFAKARKMIDKLADGPQKAQFIERTNAKEALSLATKGNTVEAEILAGHLSTAVYILEVYPVIISKCVERKDHSCATGIVYQAMKQLKRADTAPLTPPAGISASVVATTQDFDPVLASLGKLAKSVFPINELLALEVLDEMIVAANHSEMDTGQGRTGFDVDVFRKLASSNETRTRQAAETLSDPLRRIVALATIYQWKAKELEKNTKPNTRMKNKAN